MASTTKSAGWSKTQLQSTVKSMENNLTNMNKALKKLDSDLATIQKGDGKTAYWSGQRAYTWVTYAITCVNKDKKLLNFLDDITDALDAMVKYGSNF